MTELLQHAFELASALPAEEQDAIAAHLIGEIRGAGDDPSVETLETFLGVGLHRPAATPAEMEEMRAMAKEDPGIAAVLRLAEQGGLDVETILAIRNAE
ncbi:MAG TPA: hypothetical protein VE871_11590 [Longimicrobium sp.]|nr:hypothetical protein [Longimicrobium sp.]